MTINLELSEENADWLAPETYDGFWPLDAEEQTQRATEVLITAIQEHIESSSREAATAILSEFTPDERREARRAAIQRDGGDYLDRIAAELVERSNYESEDD